MVPELHLSGELSYKACLPDPNQTLVAVFDSESAHVKMTTQQAWSVDAVGAGSSHSVAIIRRAGAPLHLLCISVLELEAAPVPS